MKKIEELLKEHKDRKATLEIIQSRIDAYKIALDNPAARNNVYYVSQGINGMPKGEGTGSIVEKTIMTDEAICQGLRNLIDDERSRAAHLINKVDLIERALKVLTHQQKYIIECRYFEELGWNDTEKDFNEKFYEKEPEKSLSVHRLKKIKDKALDRLENIVLLKKVG